MANIIGLGRAAEQEDAETNGNDITGTEKWILNLDSNATQIEANKLLNNLNDGNQYGFMEISVTPHPDDSTVFSTGFTVSRDSKLLSQFYVSSTITNNLDATRDSAGSAGVGALNVFDYEEVDILVEVDTSPITGNAIAASNGEAYFPKLLRRDTLTRIIITRNESNFDPRKAKKFRNKLNKGPLNIDGRGYEERLLLLESYTGKSAIDSRGRDYYQIRFSLLYNPESHRVVLLDVASGPDKNGTFPQIKAGVENKPFKLDGNGLYMVKARQEDPEDFEVREFFIHDEIAMGSLSL